MHKFIAIARQPRCMCKCNILCKLWGNLLLSILYVVCVLSIQTHIFHKHQNISRRAWICFLVLFCIFFKFYFSHWFVRKKKAFSLFFVWLLSFILMTNNSNLFHGQFNYISLFWWQWEMQCKRQTMPQMLSKMSQNVLSWFPTERFGVAWFASVGIIIIVSIYIFGLQESKLPTHLRYNLHTLHCNVGVNVTS